MVEHGESEQAPESGYRMTVLPFGDTLRGIESESTRDFRLAQSSVFAVLAKRIGVLHRCYFFKHVVRLMRLGRGDKTAEVARMASYLSSRRLRHDEFAQVCYTLLTPLVALHCF